MSSVHCRPNFFFLSHRDIAHVVAVMRSVHTHEAQQTDSHVVQDTASANAVLRSLELALPRSQRHMLCFSRWSWCCVGHSRHWCTVLVHWRECCASHSRCSCRICLQTCRHRFVHALTWNDNWCASALHSVTHDDGAVDAKTTTPMLTTNSPVFTP